MSLEMADIAVRAESIKSVPSPWARVLIFEEALSPDNHHPAHEQVVQEWRGLLACLGLREHLRLDVEFVPVELEWGDPSHPLSALLSLAPGPKDSTTWSRLALIRIGGSLVGGVSPRTLVFTGIRSLPSGVPFRDERGRLHDPAPSFKDQRDGLSLTLLLEWLNETAKRLRDSLPSLNDYLGVTPDVGGIPGIPRSQTVLDALDLWTQEVAELVRELGGEREGVVDGFGPSELAARFPSDHPARAPLDCIRPIQSSYSEKSDLRALAIELTVNPGKTGLIIKDDVPFNGLVTLPHGASFTARDGRPPSEVSAAQLGDPVAPDIEGLFAEKLIKLSDPSKTHAGCLQTGDRSFLLPLLPETLRFIPAERLSSWLTIPTGTDERVTVRLEIPVQKGLAVRFDRVYHSDEVISDAATPELAVWPDFEAEHWSHYFYFIRELAKDRNLKLEPVEFKNVTRHIDMKGSGRWGVSSSPLRAWNGTVDENLSGLLLLKGFDRVVSPPAPEKAWDVSIDFGSTHTRAFRRSQAENGVHPISLRQRAAVILGGSAAISLGFFPPREQEIGDPSEPRSLVRVRQSASETPWLPPDGMIFWEAIESVAEAPEIRTNLKWHEPGSEDEKAFQCYIAQLYLCVAAEAAAVQASVASLTTAYPSVFPDSLRHKHEQQWKTLENAGLGRVVVHRPIRESTALARFLAKDGKAIGANALAIDIGGSTSDLAVWFDDQHTGESVKLAGGLISRLVATSPRAQEAVTDAATAPPIGQAQALIWDVEDFAKNELLFNTLLRKVAADNGGTAEVVSKNLYGGPNTDGEFVVAHVGYLFASLAFFMGLLVRRSGLERDHYSLHFAGHGSDFLGWIDRLGHGASTDLTKRFFLAGLGTQGNSAIVSVSDSGSDAKEEVGRGILSPGIDDSTAETERVTFVGEEGFKTDSGDLDWTDPLKVRDLANIKRPDGPQDLPPLELLSQFLETFRSFEVGSVVAEALGLPISVDEPEFRGVIYDRLFGPTSPWAKAEAMETVDHLILEPFFIAEAKALLEVATGNSKLFDD